MSAVIFSCLGHTQRNSTGHFWLSFIMYKINYIAIYNESVFMANPCQVFRYI